MKRRPDIYEINGRPHVLSADGNLHPHSYIGLDGKPNKHTPENSPYSYDAFFEWKSSDFDDHDFMVDHDRMMSWDGKAFRKAVAEVWPQEAESQMFYGRTPADIERFLCAYYGKSVKLTAVLRGCNVSNGFPIWTFAYKG